MSCTYSRARNPPQRGRCERGSGRGAAAGRGVGVPGLAQPHPLLRHLPLRGILFHGRAVGPCLAKGARMRRYADGGAGDHSAGAAASHPEHGATLLWRGHPITGGDEAGEPVVALDALSAGADGPCSVVCRSALVTDLAGAHALCRLPTCACPCHEGATALEGAG